MTSFQKARYALWNHPSQQIQGAVEWRVTPRSKKYVAVVRPVVLRGTAVVVLATRDDIELRISSSQADDIALWTSSLPSGVMRSTAETAQRIRHTGPFTYLDNTYTTTLILPNPGDRVHVRLVVGVTSIGPLSKAQIEITDVRLDDVTATGQ